VKVKNLAARRMMLDTAHERLGAAMKRAPERSEILENVAGEHESMSVAVVI